MANEKISQFNPLIVLASGDYFPIVDISEPSLSDQNKRVGVDVLDNRYYPAASGAATLVLANSAQSTANSALATGTAALASGNAALATLAAGVGIGEDFAFAIQ